MPKNLFGNFGAFNYQESLRAEASLQIENTRLATVRTTTTLTLLLYYMFERLLGMRASHNDALIN